ncbi:MAG: triose-phosphate isomerase [Flavobacteriales bacterium]|nr:MAG: triose-phosphate isomerase [Flavobacteriales bacterium]
MRIKIVAGNWKMNKSHSEAIELVQKIMASDYDNSVQLIVFPPSIYASEIAKITSSSATALGIQNCSEYDSGAYTGQLSASMIRSMNVKYVLVGHSEIREYFNEQNKTLASKINQLITNDLTPIYCCGEVLQEREKGNHFNLVKSQIEEGLFHLDENQIAKCVIAYEPVWAIGTGVTASSSQAQEMHHFIRSLLAEKYSENVAGSISILYGGSCNPENSQELFANPDIDGGLIGGASLNAVDFIAIANSFS